MYTVGELSRLTGVTVRALHHYDEIGLCCPSARSNAGYRLYTDADVLRLRQVLLLRQLGIPLRQISGALEQAGSRQDLFMRHRRALVEERARLDEMIAAVDAALQEARGEMTMEADDVKALFRGFDPSLYEQEANERWGDSEPYKQSIERTKKYGPAEWEDIQREADAIYELFAEQLRGGAAPGEPAVQRLVAQHRAHIDRWFYACSKEIHRGLGEMYVSDPRFTQNIDRRAAGLAQFMRDAILAA